MNSNSGDQPTRRSGRQRRRTQTLDVCDVSTGARNNQTRRNVVTQLQSQSQSCSCSRQDGTADVRPPQRRRLENDDHCVGDGRGPEPNSIRENARNGTRGQAVYTGNTYRQPWANNQEQTLQGPGLDERICFCD